jgi:hypothetical protein
MRAITMLVTLWLTMSPCLTFASEPLDGAAPQGAAAPERPAVGVSIGATGNGNPLMGGGSAPQVGFVLETPFGVDKRIRLDASRSSWTSSLEETTDRITLQTVSVSATRVDHWSDVTAVFAGLGVGGYHYAYQRRPLSSVWRGGVVAMVGFEVLNSARTSGFTFETRLHAASGARREPYLDTTMFKVEAVVGVKKRF